MLAALDTALAVYATPARWRTVPQAGVRQDFSWDASVAAYVQEYRKAIMRLRVTGREREE